MTQPPPIASRDDFDFVALFDAIDQRRTASGLSWQRVADAVWEQSAVLNRQRADHPISPATLSGMKARRQTSCQHALAFLRWLGRTPESFVPAAAGGSTDVPLPQAGPDRRLRWDLRALYTALDATRRERALTWSACALELRCTPSQLTGLRTARFATGMLLAMRIVRWLDRPAADFIRTARW